MTESQQSTSSYRVKLYELVDGNWTDRGTGKCYYKMGSEGKTDELHVVSEEDEGVALLVSPVIKSNMYQKQKDTLILWTERDQREYAVSFQDPLSCQRIWNSFGERGMVDRDSMDDDEKDKMMDEDELDAEVVTDNNEVAVNVSKSTNYEYYKLPEPTLNNMKSIIETLDDVRYSRDKDRFAEYIMDEDYIEKLVPIFNECEDLEAYNEIHIIYDLLLHILNLNDQNVIEHVVNEELIMSIMGILEYDPKTPHQKTQHRAFIRSKGSSKDHVEELDDEELIKEIDETFRLRYLHNVLTNHQAPYNLLETISNMLQQNNVRIIRNIQNDSILLTKLTSTITNEKTTREMQVMIRFSFYKSLAHHGLIDILCYALNSKDQHVQKTSVQLLESLVQADAHTVRLQIVSQEKDEECSRSLLKVMIEEATMETNPSNQVNTPTNTSSITDNDNEEFLTVLYEKHMATFYQFIINLEIEHVKLEGEYKALSLSRDKNDLCKRLMDLLTFSFKSHGFRFKYFLLTNNCVPKILQLTRSNCAHMKLFPIRFIRACLETKDEFYYTNFMKMNIFETIVRLTIDNKEKDNLVSSACFSLFELIRTENYKPLINYLITEFDSVLDTVVFTKTSLLHKLKYEQMTSNTEDKAEKSDKEEDASHHDTWSKVDKEEEDYFNTSDEEDSDIKPLVDYEDEDEDEEEKKEDEQHILTPPLKRKHEDEEEEDEEDSLFVRHRKKLQNEQVIKLKTTTPKQQTDPFSLKRNHEEEEEESKSRMKLT
ncbi:hypothetical protein G6F57_008306 [Rhizopus arrhizus]|uniref:Serine/threonine-protein phosphatase 4 regulatory subunit 3-like central domain-containing protein n=1 Tax=Rhizopus oryzae TaxID=64495 RepID=A0A9P6X5G2_RHIOR|nr:hypothetical protein G6F21_008408 [Rhizopus arrhizus]KAG1418969.1 hypothetical protein G6F58_004829 [Rhizopus delemar]KAG0818125.1 hypothetical protein G6F20_001819 [Rhizopus arrhizus]KAG0827013.1 hypothetical protein G6F19_009023 [Rhizopus arrhizus]KAG0828358.1 hypothetical protein G6F18_009111 [Rhizopus arrhizus]